MSSDVSVRELLSRANSLLASGDIANARSIAQQAYNLNKKDPDVLVLVSKVIIDPARQRNVLQQALQIAPTHREALARLATLDGSPIPVVPATPQRSFPVLPILAGVFGVVALLVLVGILVSHSHSDGSATEPTAAVALQSTVGGAPVLVPSTPTNNRVSVSPTALPSVTLVPSVILPTANTAGLDPLVLTATALQQGIAATNTISAQAAGLMQQGALSATNISLTQSTGQSTALELHNHLYLLAFEVWREEDRIFQLWKSNADGSDPIALTDGQTVVLPGFSWSPDGKQIAFLGARNQTIGIYRFDLVLNDIKLVLSMPKFDQGSASFIVAWAPDGSAIAYTREDGLYTVTPDGSTVKHIVTLPSGSFEHSPAWSQDSQQIAYVADDDIYLANRDGSGVKPVTTGKTLRVDSTRAEIASLQLVGRIITWTPDGNLAYTIVKPDGAVYTVSPDGTHTKLFLKQPYTLSWSPDGKQIAGLLLTADNTKQGIYLLNADGTGTPKLLVKFGQFGKYQQVLSPVWQS